MLVTDFFIPGSLHSLTPFQVQKCRGSHVVSGNSTSVIPTTAPCMTHQLLFSCWSLEEWAGTEIQQMTWKAFTGIYHQYASNRRAQWEILLLTRQQTDYSQKLPRNGTVLIPHISKRCCCPGVNTGLIWARSFTSEKIRLSGAGRDNVFVQSSTTDNRKITASGFL